MMGTIILAGGQGTRLGFEGPKALFPIRGKCLIDHLLEKKHRGPLAIMTSPLNEEEIRRHVGKGIFTFPQTLLENPGGRSPGGNGEVYRSFVQTKEFTRWKENGIQYIHILPIDNPLAEPFPLDLLQLAKKERSDLAVRTIRRDDPLESVGILIEKKGRLHVEEYFEVDEALRTQCDAQGELKYPHAFINQFLMTRELFEMGGVLTDTFPWHVAIKTVHGQQVHKKERFAFDLFPYAKNFSILESKRAECFAPVKTLEDITQFG